MLQINKFKDSYILCLVLIPVRWAVFENSEKVRFRLHVKKGSYALKLSSPYNF